MADPFACNADGSAKDPAAYSAALRADPERVKALQVSAQRNETHDARRCCFASCGAEAAALRAACAHGVAAARAGARGGR